MGEELTEVLFDTALILSLVCTSTVVVSYLRFKDLRRNAFQLVLNLAVADFGLALSFFLRGGSSKTSIHEGALCTAQGFVQTYFELAGPLWTAVMSFALRRTVVLREYGSWKSSFPRYLAFAWGVPAVAAAIPFAVMMKPYSPAPQDESALRWCWINEDSRRAAILQMAVFYIPLWIVIFYNLIASVSIRRHVHRMTRESTEPSENALAMHLRRLVRRLQWYPFILLVCQAPITVIRIYPILTLAGRRSSDYNHSVGSMWFQRMTLILIASVGMAHSIAYGLTSSVRNAWAKECPCECFRNLLRVPDGRHCHAQPAFPRSSVRSGTVCSHKSSTDGQFPIIGSTSKFGGLLDDPSTYASTRQSLSRIEHGSQFFRSTEDRRLAFSESNAFTHDQPSMMPSFPEGDSMSGGDRPPPGFPVRAGSPLPNRMILPEHELDLDMRVSIRRVNGRANTEPPLHLQVNLDSSPDDHERRDESSEDFLHDPLLPTPTSSEATTEP